MILCWHNVLYNSIQYYLFWFSYNYFTTQYVAPSIVWNCSECMWTHPNIQHHSDHRQWQNYMHVNSIVFSTKASIFKKKMVDVCENHLLPFLSYDAQNVPYCLWWNDLSPTSLCCNDPKCITARSGKRRHRRAWSLIDPINVITKVKFTLSSALSSMPI